MFLAGIFLANMVKHITKKVQNPSVLTMVYIWCNTAHLEKKQGQGTQETQFQHQLSHKYG